MFNSSIFSTSNALLQGTSTHPFWLLGGDPGLQSRFIAGYKEYKFLYRPV